MGATDALVEVYQYYVYGLPTDVMPLGPGPAVSGFEYSWRFVLQVPGPARLRTRACLALLRALRGMRQHFGPPTALLSECTGTAAAILQHAAQHGRQ
jgi:hypothetical protein